MYDFSDKVRKTLLHIIPPNTQIQSLKVLPVEIRFFHGIARVAFEAHAKETVSYGGQVYCSENKRLCPKPHPQPGVLAPSHCGRSLASGATDLHLSAPSQEDQDLAMLCYYLALASKASVVQLSLFSWLTCGQRCT